MVRIASFPQRRGATQRLRFTLGFFRNVILEKLAKKRDDYFQCDDVMEAPSRLRTHRKLRRLLRFIPLSLRCVFLYIRFGQIRITQARLRFAMSLLDIQTPRWEQKWNCR